MIEHFCEKTHIWLKASVNNCATELLLKNYAEITLFASGLYNVEKCVDNSLLWGEGGAFKMFFQI